MTRRPAIFCLFLAVLLTVLPAHAQEDAYTVQVAVCDRHENAASIAANLKTKGYAPYIHEYVDTEGKVFYLVRLEDFSLEAAARAAADSYTAQTGAGAVVTRRLEAATADISANCAPATGGSAATVSQPYAAAVQPAVSAQPQDVRDADTDQERRMYALETELESLRQEMKQLRAQQEARRKLEITDDEKTAKEKEILQAAGREYTTMKKNTLGLEYNFNYQYYSYDVITQATEIESHANHNITNSIYVEYALLDNLTLNLNVPFAYKWDRTGTDRSKEVTDLGDISLGFQYQPLRSGNGLPTTILFGSFSLDTGRSPYEINIDEDLATGSGYYAATAGLSLSKTIDPIIAFGNIGYTYNFKADGINQERNGLTLESVAPGDAISGTIGLGFALSYNVSMNFSYQYTFRYSSTYGWREINDTENGSQTSSILYIGTGWRFTPKYSFNMKVGIGLTDEDPDVVVSFRLPFEFDLAD